MQVEVHHIDAQVARAHNAQQGVQVGAIAVHQAARLVHQPRHLFHILIEQPQRVGVGEHQPGQRVIAFERAAPPGRHCHARRT